MDSFKGLSKDECGKSRLVPGYKKVCVISFTLTFTPGTCLSFTQQEEVLKFITIRNVFSLSFCFLLTLSDEIRVKAQTCYTNEPHSHLLILG